MHPCFISIYNVYKFLSAANQRLETGGAAAGLLSSAVEQTLLTHVSCTNL